MGQLADRVVTDEDLDRLETAALSLCKAVTVGVGNLLAFWFCLWVLATWFSYCAGART